VIIKVKIIFKIIIIDDLVKSSPTCHSRLRGNDKNGTKLTFYEVVIIDALVKSRKAAMYEYSPMALKSVVPVQGACWMPPIKKSNYIRS